MPHFQSPPIFGTREHITSEILELFVEHAGDCFRLQLDQLTLNERPKPTTKLVGII